MTDDSTQNVGEAQEEVTVTEEAPTVPETAEPGEEIPDRNKV